MILASPQVVHLGKSALCRHDNAWVVPVCTSWPGPFREAAPPPHSRQVLACKQHLYAGNRMVLGHHPSGIPYAWMKVSTDHVHCRRTTALCAALAYDHPAICHLCPRCLCHAVVALFACFSVLPLSRCVFLAHPVMVQSFPAHLCMKTSSGVVFRTGSQLYGSWLFHLCLKRMYLH